jgi:DNA end-binding protein Ku
MARPIWSGTLSFGLLNVPVSLMSGERSVDLHFRMLDSRSNTPVRYERVNAETGEEVPWKEIVKAFEYAKGSYVVLEPEDIKSAAAEGREVVDVKTFVAADSIGPEYFEKPYILVPGKKAEKGYVLLRETLKRTGRIGIARVVIRTREYLSAVMPRGNALVLMLMRYPQELVDAEDYKIPEGQAAQYRISDKEIQMAEQLIESMSDDWNPADYRDEFRDRLRKVIEQRMKSKGVVSAETDDDDEVPENATTNVVDFMSLLQKSLASNKRTPAGGSGSRAAGKSGGTKAAAKAKPKTKSTRKASAGKPASKDVKKKKAG